VAATSFSEVLPVGAATATTTTLSSSLDSSALGQSVTFTATVSPALATGSIQFNIDGNDVGTPVALASGIATFSTSLLTEGTHTIQATYGGDGSFIGSVSDPLTQTVGPAGPALSTTVVASSLNPSTFGQDLTFTASVTGGGAPPTGTVQFTVDGSDVGTPVDLIGGVATFSTPTPLSVGSHPVTATYSGSTDYSTSSGSLTQVVNKVATATTVASNDTNAKAGDTVTLTATTTWVAPGAGTPTGDVVFRLTSGTTTLQVASVPIDVSGVTTYTWVVDSTQVGRWTLTATYSGDANFTGSTSSGISQRVR
jgi:hypothetical protein